jgi:glycosyltransferase involved in cell wall biosynthesis
VPDKDRCGGLGLEHSNQGFFLNYVSLMSNIFTAKQRVLFIFKGGRRERLTGNDPFPTEFFYGFCELKENGHAVDLLEEADILALAGRNGPLVELARWIFRLLFPGSPALLWFAAILARRPVRERLNDCDVVVATTQTYGFCLGLLRRLRVIHPRVVFLVMGTYPDTLSALYRPVIRWLLEGCEVTAISEGEAIHLASRLNKNQAFQYLPFGVDATFWTPDRQTPAIAEGDYVLSIGNDGMRDYRTLFDAWLPHYPTLRVVTRLPVKPDKENIEIIAGDWRQRIFSDSAVRDIIRASQFVVLPIRRTTQPSGQSACLQAMACGKAVILSDIEGMWDRQAMKSDETCLLVEPLSVPALRSAVEKLLSDVELAGRLGAAARQVIERRLNTATMANAMKDILATTPPMTRPFPSHQTGFEAAKKD